MLVATHVDRHHVHSHFVVNSVNAETGLKFHSDNHKIQRLRDASDKLCMEYGFSVVVPKSKKVKGMSTAEYHVAEKGQSWKLDLAIAIDEAMRYAVSKEHFIELMEMEGYEVKWKDTYKYIRSVYLYWSERLPYRTAPYQRARYVSKANNLIFFLYSGAAPDKDIRPTGCRRCDCP